MLSVSFQLNRALILGLLASSSLVLGGCQQVIKKPTANSVTLAPTETEVTDTTQAIEKISQNQAFHLQGKIGVKTPQQSGSAFFTWAQQQDEFDIELSGILGVGKTQISGTPGEVILNSAKTGLIRAETPEELLARATGWQAPITHLVDWVQGQSASNNAQMRKDDSGRPIQLDEDGWNVEFSYNAAAQLPNKLILKQALESGKENRITMIIQNR